MTGRPAARRWRPQPSSALALLATSASPAWAQEIDAARAAGPGAQQSRVCRRAPRRPRRWRRRSRRPRLNWLPQGDLLSLLAPSPNIQCLRPIAARTRHQPVHQHHHARGEPHARSRGTSVFTRTEIKLIQPLWDFGKISAGVAAAEAGVGVSRQREAGARADLELNVRKAYYGLKFARDVLDMLDEGSSYVDDGARRSSRRTLAAAPATRRSPTGCGSGRCAPSSTGGILEAKRLQSLARDSLRTLLGPDAPADIDVDDEPFEPPEVKERPVELLRGSGALRPPRGAAARVRRQGEARAGRSRAPQGVPRPGAGRHGGVSPTRRPSTIRITRS